MRKSSIFISATLTTFALAILYSVVSAYRANINAPEAATQPIATLAPEPTDTPTQTVVTPEEAAQLAVQVIGHDDLLSAESANINGVDAYKITFKNNDIVYVGLDGQVLSVQVAPVVVKISSPVKKNKNNHNDGGGGGGGESTNHEDHDDN